MKHIAQSYEEFINEWDSAMPFNTPGMGNVTSTGTLNSFMDTSDSGDQDGTRKFHPDLTVEDDGSYGWMLPSSNYNKRNWLLPNYTQYMSYHQSNARFQIGNYVTCVDPNMECYNCIAKIVAFEDNTIRIEILNSETGIGQTSKQYRCLASCLKKI